MGRKKEPATPIADNVIGLADRAKAKSNNTDQPSAIPPARIADAWGAFIEREMFKLETIIKCCQHWQNRSPSLKGPERLSVLLDMSADISEELQEKFRSFREFKSDCETEKQP